MVLDVSPGIAIARRTIAPRAVADGSVERWGKPLAVGLTALAVGFAIFVLWTLFSDAQYATMLGNDRAIYVSAVSQWERGGDFYLPFQVAGPYEVQTGDVMYPPLALPAFVLLALLPPWLYWALPIAIIALVIVHHRPAWWAWPFIAACLAYPWVLMLVVAGNPVIWVAAAVAAATIYGWPAMLVVLKPSLLPFIIIGIRKPSWWVVGAGLAILAVAFGSLWIDWVQVVLNARGWRAGLFYSLSDAPLLVAPLIAWFAGRHRKAGSEPRSSVPSSS